MLPEPFEDFYKLEGAQREQYLKLKATAKAEHDALCARLKADGLNDDEIVEWLRYYRRSGGK